MLAQTVHSSFLFSNVPTVSVSLVNRVGYCVLYISHTRAVSCSGMCTHVRRLQRSHSGAAAGEPVERGPVKLHTQADPSILTPCPLCLAVLGLLRCVALWVIGPHLQGCLGQAEVLDLSKRMERALIMSLIQMLELVLSYLFLTEFPVPSSGENLSKSVV